MNRRSPPPTANLELTETTLTLPTTRELRAGGNAEEVVAASGSGYARRVLDTTAAGEVGLEVEGAVEEKADEAQLEVTVAPEAGGGGDREDGGGRDQADGEGEGQEGEGMGRGLVLPSFCPSEPFERYAALHHDITGGEAKQRCAGSRSCVGVGVGVGNGLVSG